MNHIIAVLQIIILRSEATFVSTQPPVGEVPVEIFLGETPIEITGEVPIEVTTGVAPIELGMPFLPCCRQSSDHDPDNMLEVLKNPRDYLSGPRSLVNVTDPRHFLIVGAGMAGLSSAYVLLQLGHRVTMLESDTRWTEINVINIDN